MSRVIPFAPYPHRPIRAEMEGSLPSKPKANEDKVALERQAKLLEDAYKLLDFIQKNEINLGLINHDNFVTFEGTFNINYDVLMKYIKEKRENEKE